MRYFLIDRIDELKKLDYAVATKAVTLAEDCFEHHFPGQPIYPGALLIEAMAQLGGALLEISLRDQRDPCPRCVVGTVKAKFRDFVGPGDQLRLRASVVSHHHESAKVRVEGTREGERVCEAELVYMLLEVPDPRLHAARDEFLDTLTRQTRFVE